MSIINDAKKYLHEEPTVFMTKDRKINRAFVLIEKLVEEIERRDKVIHYAKDIIVFKDEEMALKGVISYLDEALSQLEDK